MKITDSGKQENKKQLRILDYRNGKYQGEVMSERFVKDGLGMFLDRNYLLTLSEWRNNNIEGYCFTIYPDNTIFYGRVEQKKIKGFCTYQVSQQYIIYFYDSSANEPSKNVRSSASREKPIPAQHTSNHQILTVVDFTQLKTIVITTLNKTVFEQIINHESNILGASSLIDLYKNEGKLSKEEKSLFVREEIKYSSLEEKWKIIEQCFGMKVQASYRNYLEFISVHFQQKYKQLIRISKVKEEVVISFKKTSIYVKIQDPVAQNQPNIKSQKQLACDNSFLIKAISFINTNEQTPEISKKTIMTCNNKTTTTIYEETISLSRQKYHYTSAEERPQQCNNSLEKYYKQSFNFINQFLQLQHLYQTKHLFYLLEDFVNYYVTNKYAQIMLENQGAWNQDKYQIKIDYVENQNHKDKQKSKEKQQETYYMNENRYNKLNLQYPLTQVKEDIYRAAKKIKSKPKYESPSKSFKRFVNESYKQQQKRHQKSLSIYQSPLSVALNYDSPSKRSVYLQKSPFKDSSERKVKYSSPSKKNGTNNEKLKELLSQNKRTYVYLETETVKNTTKNRIKVGENNSHLLSKNSTTNYGDFQKNIYQNNHQNSKYNYLDSDERHEPHRKIIINPRPKVQANDQEQNNINSLAHTYFEIENQLKHKNRRGKSFTDLTHNNIDPYQKNKITAKKASLANASHHVSPKNKYNQSHNKNKNKQYDFKEIRRGKTDLDKLEKILIKNQESTLASRKVYKYLPE